MSGPTLLSITSVGLYTNQAIGGRIKQAVSYQDHEMTSRLSGV